MIHKLEESTTRDMAESIFPTKHHSKMALAVIEYIAEESKGDNPRADIATLKGFVKFLIDKKGYN